MLTRPKSSARDPQAELINELAEQFRPVLDHSPDGVYLWLDEHHVVCNQNLADMFGWTVEEWNTAPPSLGEFVAEQDWDAFVWNYQQNVVKFAAPATFRFTARRKDGSTFAAETDMIPVSIRGLPVAYHFVREVGDARGL